MANMKNGQCQVEITVVANAFVESLVAGCTCGILLTDTLRMFGIYFNSSFEIL